MKCKAVQLMLDEYAAGTIESSVRRMVDDHCAVCRSCSSDLRMVLEVRALRAGSEEWKPSENYWNSLLPAIHERIDAGSRRTFPVWTYRFALPAAAVVVLLVAVIWFFPGKGGMVPASATLSTVPTEELQDFLDRQEILGLNEVIPVDRTLSSADLSVLKDIVKSDSIVIYQDPDHPSDYDMIPDKDAEDIAAVLEGPQNVSR